MSGAATNEARSDAPGSVGISHLSDGRAGEPPPGAEEPLGAAESLGADESLGAGEPPEAGASEAADAVVADEATLVVRSPSAVVATTVNAYVVPLARPVTVTGEEVAPTTSTPSRYTV